MINDQCMNQLMILGWYIFFSSIYDFQQLNSSVQTALNRNLSRSAESETIPADSDIFRPRTEINVQ